MKVYICTYVCACVCVQEGGEALVDYLLAFMVFFSEMMDLIAGAPHKCRPEHWVMDQVENIFKDRVCLLSNEEVNNKETFYKERLDFKKTWI